MSKSPPFSSAGIRKSPGDAALERAAMALRMQNLGEAERLAEGVLKADRGNLGAAMILGQALLAQGRAEQAIVPLERAAKRSGDAAIETLLAAALAGAGRRDEALDQLRRTTARRPPFPPAFREHAGQLARLGRIDEAIAVVESGLALSPDVVELRVDLGSLHFRRNDRRQARAAYTAALAAAPGRHDILVALARVMHLDGDYAQAADVYRRALGLQPDDAAARADLGLCQLEMGEREAGEASLRAATRGRPDMMGRAIRLLAGASHGRFFLRQSAAAKFLGS